MPTIPLVTIVIPAYNSRDFIHATIDRCLAQTYPNCEIIVVDDGSTDQTPAYLREQFGQQVRIIQQANSGPAIARNTGIEAAQGDYIQFCDSDDLLHPEKIARCMAALQQNPDAGGVFCRMQPIDATGTSVPDSPPAPPDEFFRADDLFCALLQANGSAIQTSTLLVRKSALLDVGAYRADTQQRCAEDWDMLLRLTAAYALIGITDILVRYRVRSGSLSDDRLLMAQGRLQTIRYARHYARRTSCITPADYDALEAGRYHVFAIEAWRAGRRKQARDAFQQAARRTPEGATTRRFYALLTYVLPLRVTRWIATVRQNLPL